MNNMLADCLYIGDTARCVSLIENGADVHAHNDLPLRLAVERGYASIVRLLLEHGADVHARNDDPLIKAVLLCNVDIVRLLLKHGANVHARDDAALREAIYLKCDAIVDILLANGADTRAIEPDITVLAYTGHAGILRALLKHGNIAHSVKVGDGNALDVACEFGHLEIIKILLDVGVGINVRSLRCAINSQNAECVTLLLSYGADPTLLTDEERKELALLIGDGESDVKPVM